MSDQRYREVSPQDIAKKRRPSGRPFELMNNISFGPQLAHDNVYDDTDCKRVTGLLAVAFRVIEEPDA